MNIHSITELYIAEYVLPFVPTFFLYSIFVSMLLPIISKSIIGINSRGTYVIGAKGALYRVCMLFFPWDNFKNIRIEQSHFLSRRIRKVYFCLDKVKTKNINFFVRNWYGKMKVSVEEKDLPELLEEIKKYAPERLHPPEVLEFQSGD